MIISQIDEVADRYRARPNFDIANRRFPCPDRIQKVFLMIGTDINAGITRIDGLVFQWLGRRFQLSAGYKYFAVGAYKMAMLLTCHWSVDYLCTVGIFVNQPFSRF